MTASRAPQFSKELKQYLSLDPQTFFTQLPVMGLSVQARDSLVELYFYYNISEGLYVDLIVDLVSNNHLQYLTILDEQIKLGIKQASPDQIGLLLSLHERIEKILLPIADISLASLEAVVLLGNTLIIAKSALHSLKENNFSEALIRISVLIGQATSSLEQTILHNSYLSTFKQEISTALVHKEIFSKIYNSHANMLDVLLNLYQNAEQSYERFERLIKAEESVYLRMEFRKIYVNAVASLRNPTDIARIAALIATSPLSSFSCSSKDSEKFKMFAPVPSVIRDRLDQSVLPETSLKFR